MSISTCGNSTNRVSSFPHFFIKARKCPMPSRSVGNCTLFAFLVLAAVQLLWSQRKGSFPEDRLTQTELSSHIRFLASDEMLGRMTGTNEINIAARYVAEQFRMAGVLPVP